MDPRLVPSPLRERRAACTVGPAPQAPRRALTFRRSTAIACYFGGLVRARWRGPLDGGVRGRLLRELFQSFGAAATKLAQLLGMRRDVFSVEFCREMSQLQDRALAFPGAVARRTVEDDLGVPLEDVFSEFSETPFAAASIGQAHEGRLRTNNTRVVIKVRRPFVLEQTNIDLRWLAWVFRLLDHWRIMPTFGWDDLSWELQTALREEMDYRFEGTYLSRMRQSLGRHGIHVPKVFSRYTTDRVLVMEYIEGVFMSEFIATEQEDPGRVEAWLQNNNVSRAVVGRTLHHSLNRQVFEDNFFHSDLHPGNILLLRNSEVALIDFGAVGSLDQESVEMYSRYYQAIVDRQWDRAADLFLLLAPHSGANSRTAEFRQRYIAIMKAFETKTATGSLDFHERSVVSVFGAIMAEVARFDIPLEWYLVRADRAQLTLDASLMYLLPNVDYLELVRDYWREAKTRTAVRRACSLGSERTLGILTERLPQLLEDAEDRVLFATEVLRGNAEVARHALGAFVVVLGSCLRLLTFVAVLLGVAGAATYLGLPGAIDLTASLNLDKAVATWRSVPPVPAAALCALLVGVTWEMVRVRSKLLRGV